MIGPLAAFRRLRMLFADEDARNLFTVPKFAGAHKHFLVIIADPHTDRIFVSHKGRFVNGRIRSVQGRPTHVVRDMLKKSQFKQDLLDQFIGSLIDVLKLDIKAGNQFYTFIDAAIYKLARAASDARKEKKGGKRAAAPPSSAGVQSPIKAVDGRPSGDI